MRKLVGRHLVLYTDLPAANAVDELPTVFDAAVAQWAEYFEVDQQRIRYWRMQGFLMRNRATFDALGLLPRENRDFANGYSNGFELWLMEQPSDYYRRHLLLHEGTHGFMYTQLGDTGPGWYMEGMAELFGTHRWQEGMLTMRVVPKQRDDAPMWGRIKLIRDAVEIDRQLALSAVMALDKRQVFSTEEYAWCWGMCQLLDSHPQWQKRFRQFAGNVQQRDFNQRFQNAFGKQWPDLLVEWQAFLATLDYGYDPVRMAVVHRENRPIDQPTTVTIAADRGWQSTGWLLDAGKFYRLTAAGRYQIADPGRPWPCEPGGVTLRYHESQPLGKLLGAWRSAEGNRFSEPFPIGLSAVLKSTEDAILYLRVNDSAAELSDNRGELSASIQPVAD